MTEELQQRRRPWLLAFTALLVAAGLSWWLLSSHHIVSTDNAYVAGNIVNVSARINGSIQTLHADDTQVVAAGEVLIDLDNTDVSIALQRAESELASVVRDIVQSQHNAQQLRISWQQKQTERQRLQEDLQRRQPLLQDDAIASEELAHLRNAIRAAQQAEQAVAANYRAAQTAVAGNDLLAHPKVKLAMARYEEAWLNVARTQVRAPVSGVIARRVAQPGQMIAAGQPLLAIVPLNDVWIDANFKEAQLQDVRVGQAVDATADEYGSKIHYHGIVAGIGAGTGASFALLPAQNATGNWIKVVQRVPVRIVLDAGELQQHPLRIGLSMDVDIDTSKVGEMVRDNTRMAAPSALHVEEANAAAIKLIAQQQQLLAK